MLVIQFLAILLQSTSILQLGYAHRNPSRGRISNDLTSSYEEQNQNQKYLKYNNGSYMINSDDDFIIEQLENQLKQMKRSELNIISQIKGSHNIKEDLIHIDEEIGELYKHYEVCFKEIHQLSEAHEIYWKKQVDKIQRRITSLQISLADRLQVLEEGLQRNNYELVIRLIRDSRIHTALATFKTLNYPQIAITGIVTKTFKGEVENCKLILAFAEKLKRWPIKSYALVALYEALLVSTDLTSDAGSECAFKIGWITAQWIKSVPMGDTISIACLYDLLARVPAPVRYFSYGDHVTIRKSAERCKFPTYEDEREFRKEHTGDLNFWQAQSSKLLGSGEYFVLFDEMTKNVLESAGDKPHCARKWKGWDSQQWKPTLVAHGQILLRHKSSGKYLHFFDIGSCYEYTMSNAPETHWYVKE